MAAPVAPLVVERDGDAGVEEGELAQPLRQGVEGELDRLEHLGVGQERDLRAALLGLARDLEVGLRLAALVGLVVDEPVAPNLEVERLRQGVDDRHADAVQPARHLVAVVVELAAGVQHGHHDLGRRSSALVHVGRDPAAVVDDGDRVVDVDRDVDGVAEPGERLVDRIVHHLVDQVVEPRHARRADVHRGPLPDRLQPLEHLDLVRPVGVDLRRLLRPRLPSLGGIDVGDDHGRGWGRGPGFRTQTLVTIGHGL